MTFLLLTHFLHQLVKQLPPYYRQRRVIRVNIPHLSPVFMMPACCATVICIARNVNNEVSPPAMNNYKGPNCLIIKNPRTLSTQGKVHIRSMCQHISQDDLFDRMISSLEYKPSHPKACSLISKTQMIPCSAENRQNPMITVGRIINNTQTSLKDKFPLTEIENLQTRSHPLTVVLLFPVLVSVLHS